MVVDYGRGLWTFEAVDNPGGTITDNWHTLAKPVANTELDSTRMVLQRLRAPLSEGSSGSAPGGTRSIGFSVQEPGTRPAGIWNTTAIVSGIANVKCVVQNGADQNWSWVDSGTDVAVPANGQVPIAANLTTTGQRVQVLDLADLSFNAGTGQVTIDASWWSPTSAPRSA